MFKIKLYIILFLHTKVSMACSYINRFNLYDREMGEIRPEEVASCLS